MKIRMIKPDELPFEPTIMPDYKDFETKAGIPAYHRDTAKYVKELRAIIKRHLELDAPTQEQ